MAAMMEVPVLLLKTRTQPDDSYEEYFTSSSASRIEKVRFRPIFVPVLEHQPNTENLDRLKGLLRSGRLKEEYGGMVFTSQRAVEGWRGIVEDVESEVRDDGNNNLNSNQTQAEQTTRGILSSPTSDSTALEYTNLRLPLQDSDLPFPIYVVGPATEKSLSPLITSSSQSHPLGPSLPQILKQQSPFQQLNPQIFGAHTGTSATLAPFILSHYNALHAQKLFTFYEAPRLPFIPLVGPGPSPSKTAGSGVRRGGMVRLERDDERLRKKKLLFLVGETRKDVVKRVCEDGALGGRRVGVEEVEVYSTREREGFGAEFEMVLDESNLRERESRVVVVVVFSPQGCESMLRGIGFLDGEGRVRKGVQGRWNEGSREEGENEGTRFLIATIGPTTRDFLREKFGFEADVCAEKPSPEGVGEGVRNFLVLKDPV